MPVRRIHRSKIGYSNSILFMSKQSILTINIEYESLTECRGIELKV